MLQPVCIEDLKTLCKSLSFIVVILRRLSLSLGAITANCKHPCECVSAGQFGVRSFPDPKL